MVCFFFICYPCGFVREAGSSPTLPGVPSRGARVMSSERKDYHQKHTEKDSTFKQPSPYDTQAGDERRSAADTETYGCHVRASDTPPRETRAVPGRVFFHCRVLFVDGRRHRSHSSKAWFILLRLCHSVIRLLPRRPLEPSQFSVGMSATRRNTPPDRSYMLTTNNVNSVGNKLPELFKSYLVFY